MKLFNRKAKEVQPEEQHDFFVTDLVNNMSEDTGRYFLGLKKVYKDRDWVPSIVTTSWRTDEQPIFRSYQKEDHLFVKDTQLLNLYVDLRSKFHNHPREKVEFTPDPSLIPVKNVGSNSVSYKNEQNETVQKVTYRDNGQLLKIDYFRYARSLRVDMVDKNGFMEATQHYGLNTDGWLSRDFYSYDGRVYLSENREERSYWVLAPDGAIKAVFDTPTDLIMWWLSDKIDTNSRVMINQENILFPTVVKQLQGEIIPIITSPTISEAIKNAPYIHRVIVEAHNAKLLEKQLEELNLEVILLEY
ncbi:hypothetical protein [Lacticaseibacillus saniviri]